MPNPLNEIPQMPQQQMQNPQQNQQVDYNKLYNMFLQNPMKYLGNLNIPQGMTDGEQIVRHLASTGQVPPMLQGIVNAKLGRR
jgi:hypothetical protein